MRPGNPNRSIARRPVFDRRASWIRFTAWVSLVAFTSACGSETIQGIVVQADAHSDAPGGKFTGSADIPIRSNDPDAFSAADDATQVATQREIIVLMNTSLPQVIAPNGLLPIHVKVIDWSLGTPASGVAVFWEIVENKGLNGKGLGAVDSQMTGTDAKGLAGTVFRGNKSPAVQYRLKISCEGAKAKFIDITVTDTPKGKIKVKLSYDNQVQIGQATVRVMPMPFTCASFKPIYPPGGYVAGKSTFLGGTPEFGPLPANKKYGIYVIAKDVTNRLAAAGCADGILVLDKATTEVTVTLLTLPLQAAGPYDMVNHFDFTGAIPGQLGKILDTAVQIFYNPGAFIITQVKNIVKQFIPGILVDAAFGLFEKQLAKVVTKWLLNSSPKWLQDFFQIGQDVLQVVKKLEMLGVLKIFKVSNDFFIKGEISFTGVNLYWKLGCKKSDPNYKDCGKIPLDMKDAVKDPNFPLNFLAGTLTGTISQQTKLTIDSSTIKLNYGKLILFVLTHVILKKITGATSFSGAMSKLVNCAGIAKGIGKSILGKIGLKESAVKKACDSAVSLLVLPIEQALNGLALDTKLSLNGGATMVDDMPPVDKYKDWVGDLKVDRLTKGWWKGNIVTPSGPGNQFKGDFEATRKAGF